MLPSAWLPTLLVALLTAAQSASAAYSAGTVVLGVPCPVHAALLVPQAVDSAAHHQHGSAREAFAQFDGDK